MSNDGNQDQLAGKVKQGAGNLTGDDEMQAEGSTQEKKGQAKEKIEDAKDTVQGHLKGAGGRDE